MLASKYCPSVNAKSEWGKTSGQLYFYFFFKRDVFMNTVFLVDLEALIIKFKTDLYFTLILIQALQLKFKFDDCFLVSLPVLYLYSIEDCEDES